MCGISGTGGKAVGKAALSERCPLIRFSSSQRVIPVAKTWENIRYACVTCRLTENKKRVESNGSVAVVHWIKYHLRLMDHWSHGKKQVCAPGNRGRYIMIFQFKKLKCIKCADNLNNFELIIVLSRQVVMSCVLGICLEGELFYWVESGKFVPFMKRFSILLLLMPALGWFYHETAWKMGVWNIISGWNYAVKHNVAILALSQRTPCSAPHVRWSEKG